MTLSPQSLPLTTNRDKKIRAIKPATYLLKNF